MFLLQGHLSRSLFSTNVNRPQSELSQCERIYNNMQVHKLVIEQQRGQNIEHKVNERMLSVSHIGSFLLQTHQCIIRLKVIGRPSGSPCFWTGVSSASCQLDCRTEALWNFRLFFSPEVQTSPVIFMNMVLKRMCNPKNNLKIRLEKTLLWNIKDLCFAQWVNVFGYQYSLKQFGIIWGRVNFFAEFFWGG